MRDFLRSNFNSRGVNSREHVRFFGHNSAPRRLIGTRIGGNESYRPPVPFKTKIFDIKPRENQHLEVNIFELIRKNNDNFHLSVGTRLGGNESYRPPGAF